MSPKRPQSAGTMPGGVWLREPPAPQRSPSLTRERIVAATVETLDRDGMAGLSMRRLAEALDVHATSLYWYVATRDELFDLALDEVFGEVALPGHQSWREDVAAFMDGLRAALLRHPWAGPLASSRPLMGPHALARAEFVHAALVAAGFSGLNLSAAAAAVSNYVIGTASVEAAWRQEDQGGSRRALGEHIQRRADLYPALAAHPPGTDDGWDAHFTRGMDFLLAGLESYRS
ncbi:TetR/AcrR family transcriptional regulator [Nonomuraea endophytica]|uniref:TetR/AcrR family transcriptional regulator n=1 Tax=Nonomuraea endophytica TaxID=714136 RepID=UPI0037C60757